MLPAFLYVPTDRQAFVWGLDKAGVHPCFSSPIDPKIVRLHRDRAGFTPRGYAAAGFTPLYRHPYDPKLVQVGTWCECEDGKVRQVAEISKTPVPFIRWELGGVNNSVRHATGQCADQFGGTNIKHLLLPTEPTNMEQPTTITYEPRYIVVNMSRGPSSHPVLHFSRAAAEAEAERLAKAQPGDAFDVFASVCRKRAEVTQVVVKTAEARSHA